MATEQLTDTQTEILEFLREFISENGYPPTAREVADEMRYKSTNAAREALNAIAAKGAIVISPGIARGIKLVDGKRR